MIKKGITSGPHHEEQLGLPTLLTPEQVAAWLQTSVKAIYAKAERGSLPGVVRIGRRVYFIRSELVKSIDQGRSPYLGESGGNKVSATWHATRVGYDVKPQPQDIPGSKQGGATQSEGVRGSLLQSCVG